MKIECIEKKIIIYLYKTMLDFDNIEKLNEDIKSIFVKMIKIYNLDFFGYSKVHIYENKKYGSVLEIEKIYNNDFNMDIIDLKLVVHKDTPFYLEFNDYLFDEKKNDVIVRDNKFYLDLDKIDNIYEYIEFGKIVYK